VLSLNSQTSLESVVETFSLYDLVIVRVDNVCYYGRITAINNSNYPYEVTMTDGSRNWFEASELTFM